MTVNLDRIVHVRGTAVTALAEGSVSGAAGPVYWFHGVKQPVLILIRQGDVTTAFDLGGGRIDLDELDQRYPGRRAEFERLAAVAQVPAGSR